MTPPALTRPVIVYPGLNYSASEALRDNIEYLRFLTTEVAPDDPKQALQEIRRAVKRVGRIVTGRETGETQ